MARINVDLLDSAPVGPVPLHQVAVRLHPDDDVLIAKTPLQEATLIDLGDRQLSVRGFVASGHKLALRDLGQGMPVRRYGQVIGFTTETVRAGDHVHTHNLGVHDFARDYAFGVDAVPVEIVPVGSRRTFMGYGRADGRAGTRNFIAVIASVNCSAHTAREIARHFSAERLAAFPQVDGVIALAHQSGCGQSIGGEGHRVLQRTLAGMARNPNVGAFVFVGLGCETNQIAELIENHAGLLGAAPPHLLIQEEGGIRRTVAAGVAAVEALLPAVNRVERTPQPLSELTVALQCGGSDGWSGITANPVLGLVSDAIVRQGGTVVLAETPEIYGAEHLLTRRAIGREVGEKLVAKVRWWEAHTRRLGIEIDNNPSPGNKAGGLTTIYEKSLGAVAKGGSTPLTGVFDYAEAITTRGLTFMDTPGYDPVSCTGQVAGGCNLVVFTTGRGSVFGFKPAPSIKVATNTATYERMIDDMDFNAGRVLDGITLDSAAAELLDLVVAVAGGQSSKSEAQGVGESEFCPWNLGGTL